MHKVLFVVSFIFIVSCVKVDSVMGPITILDHEFDVIRNIDGKVDLNEFERHWNLLEPIEILPNYNWTHKIDISSDGNFGKKFGGRWLYNNEGYIARLNKQLKPIYRVEDVQHFNGFLLEDDSKY